MLDEVRVYHVMVDESGRPSRDRPDRFAFLHLGPDRSKERTDTSICSAFRERYLCGKSIVAVCVGKKLNGDTWYDLVRTPGEKSRWMDNKDFLQHQGVEYLSDVDRVNCPMCLEHPRLGLWLLANTDLE